MHQSNLGARNTHPLRNLQYSLRRRARYHDASLGFSKQNRAIGKRGVIRKIDLGTAFAIPIPDAAFRQRDSKPAVATVVRGADNTRSDRFQQRVDDCFLATDIAARRCSDHFAVNRGEILASAKFAAHFAEENWRA